MPQHMTHLSALHLRRGVLAEPPLYCSTGSYAASSFATNLGYSPASCDHLRRASGTDAVTRLRWGLGVLRICRRPAVSSVRCSITQTDPAEPRLQITCQHALQGKYRNTFQDKLTTHSMETLSAARNIAPIGRRCAYVHLGGQD